MRGIEELPLLETLDRYSTVHDFNKGVAYTYFPDSYECEIAAPLDFENNCIPSKHF